MLMITITQSRTSTWTKPNLIFKKPGEQTMSTMNSCVEAHGVFGPKLEIAVRSKYEALSIDQLTWNTLHMIVSMLFRVYLKHPFCFKVLCFICVLIISICRRASVAATTSGPWHHLLRQSQEILPNTHNVGQWIRTEVGQLKEIFFLLLVPSRQLCHIHELGTHFGDENFIYQLIYCLSEGTHSLGGVR